MFFKPDNRTYNDVKDKSASERLEWHKNRHRYNLLTIPLAVAAMLAGWFFYWVSEHLGYTEISESIFVVSTVVFTFVLLSVLAAMKAAKDARSAGTTNAEANGDKK